MGSIAKKKLNPGTVINRGIGSFEVRGKALKIEDEPNHIPIGLLDSARIIKPVEEGEILTFSHVEIEDSLAYRAWREIKEQSILLQEI